MPISESARRRPVIKEIWLPPVSTGKGCQDFKFVKHEGVLVIIRDQSPHCFPQGIMQPVVERCVVSLHAFEHLYLLATSMLKHDRWRQPHGSHRIFVVFSCDCGVSQAAQQVESAGLDCTEAKSVKQKHGWIFLQVQPERIA